eukprot:jgi/Tetstr1/435983/TSEL_024864.t1
MMEELRKLWHLLDIHDISIRPRYIQSAANVWADRLSRELDDADWQLYPRIFAYMQRLREEQAPQEIITTAIMDINRPEEQQKAAVGAALDAPRGGKTQLPKGRLSRAGLPTNTGSDAKLVAARTTHLRRRERPATIHQPAPTTADQSAMHHGQLPQVLPPPPTSQLQEAHPPAAAAPQDTEMDGEDPPPEDQPATSVDPAPHPEPAPPAAAQAPTAREEASVANLQDPSSIPPEPAHQPWRPAYPSSRQRLIGPASPSAVRPPCSRRWAVCGCSAGKAPNPKPDARPRLSAPQPKNYGRF